jgi:glycosyltransferase involved in cell wall biosynthesis
VRELAPLNRPPHVGLNLLFLVSGQTGGMEVVARELIPPLVRAAGDSMRFTAFVNASAGDGPWRDLLPTVTVPAPSRSRAWLTAAEQTFLPALTRRHGIHLLHSLANTGPFYCRCIRTITVYDLIYAHFPETTTWLMDKGVRVLVPAAARSAHRVITLSEATRLDLVETLHLDPERIDVVPPGIGAVRRVQPLADADVRARFELGDRRVLLTLSAKRPHKNLLRLISALAAVPADRRPLLVLPGYPTWHEPDLRRQADSLGVTEDVRFLGWVEDAEVEGLWEIATAFVFPSLYEGFGLPVLEAMARGVPVACSSAPSLREAAGDAALLFDPGDEHAIAEAILRLLSDESLRNDLRKRGRLRAGQFSWEQAAQLTLKSYRRALTVGRRGRVASASTIT